MIMKQSLLKTLLAATLLASWGGVESVSAQSTYTFTASEWTGLNSRGTVEVDGTALKVTKVKNHLIEIQNTTSFKLPRRQTWVIVTGTGFASGQKSANDPNITINGGSTKVKAKEDPTTTTAAFDITDQLPTETDFFGNVTINKVNIIIKTSKGEDNQETSIASDNPTITNIEFYQPDFLDNSTSIKVSSDELAKSTTNNKTTATYDASGTQKYTYEITGKQYINPSNAFIVVEMDNVNTSGTIKFAGIKVDGGTSWTYAASSGDGNKKTLTLSSNNHTLIVFSPASSNDDLLAKYTGNEGMSVTAIRFDLTNSATGNVNLYRVGFYNLAEILSLYSVHTEVSSAKWQFTGNNALRIEPNGTGSIIVKDANAKVPSIAHGKAMFRVLGNITTRNEIDFRNMVFADGVNPAPLEEDIISDYSNSSLKVLFSNNNSTYKYFPTMAKKVQIASSSYYQYKDGTTPSGDTQKVNHSTPAASAYTYTRNLTADKYYSMILPFAVTCSDLNTLGLTAYTLTNATSGTVTFSKVTSGDIAANTPMIVKANTTGYYLIPAKEKGNAANADLTISNYYESTAYDNISFVGSYAEEVPTADGKAYASYAGKCYAITADGQSFAKMGTEASTTYYRAFLVDKRSAAGAPALSIRIDEGDGTTALISVRDVDGLEQVGDGAVYSLTGVRMAAEGSLPRGIYVKNGKKFVVK